MLWTRRPVCGTRTTVIDRLTGLRAEGVIGSFGVETWPDELVLSGDSGEVAEVVDRLERWADENGVSIRPPFETRTVSPLVGSSREVLTLPVMALTVEADGLAGVYPCSAGERTWTVTDYVDVCEQAGRPARHGADGPVPVPADDWE